MDKDKIIEILSEWNFWRKDQDIGIWRNNYLVNLNNLINTGQIVAMTGVRRAGKSTLMKQFIKEHISKDKDATSFLYVNFEEPKFSDLLSLKFLEQIYEAYIEIVKPKGIPYLLLDEIHKITGWEKFVRGLHEKKEAHILISGSTSELISKELGTLLTGRWLELKIYPLDFKEYLDFNGIKIKDKLDILSQKFKIKQLLRAYLEFGGFPLATLKQEKKEILSRYFDDILEKDIVQRYKIRNVEKLRALSKYYLTNFASHISYRKVAKFLGISLDSIERFSSYMADAFLIFFIPKFSYSLKEQEVNPRKVYGIDSGLINMVSFRFSDNIGKLYENLVFLSLIQKRNEIYYYKNKKECDFVIKKGQKITGLIQVTYQLKDNEEREIKGLIDAANTFKLKKGLYVITEDKEGEEKIKGKIIKYIPLWKWLLMEI